MAEHLYTYDDPPSERDLDRTCRILDDDGIVAYPTDVNWAIGCNASSRKALDRIRLLKPTHPKEKPFSLLCADISMVSEVAVVDHDVYRILRKLMPGPYTALLTASRNLPRQIKDKRHVVGVRIPQCALMLALVKRYQKPLATTSIPTVRLNKTEDLEVPTFGYQVYEHLGHALDLVLDLGEEVMGRESTIIDFTDGGPHIVRQGVGSTEMFDLGDAND